MQLDGYWGADNAWTGNAFGTVSGGSESGIVTNAPLWNDIVDAQGSVYLNGASTSGSIGKPPQVITWQALGNDLQSTESGEFTGYIKYLLISTNHAITALEASNLWVWEMTNGVTNVSGGCVGWWKMADASNSITIADSSGSNFTGILSTEPSPIWTNRITTRRFPCA